MIQIKNCLWELLQILSTRRVIFYLQKKMSAAANCTSRHLIIILIYLFVTWFETWWFVLNYLTNTRPDFAYVVQTLSQFMQAPRTWHWRALQYILSYVQNTCGQGIKLCGSNKITLQGFCDSDWGSCVDSRRSVTIKTT